MNEQIEFPETFEKFAKEYGFKDNKEVYTNGLDLIPIFRVNQWLEHDNKLRAIEIDTAYECGKHANKPESKSNESELKPCPFCGTEVKMRKVPLYGYPGCFEFDVRCSKCGCTLDFTRADSIYYSEEEAVANVRKKWNERKETK